MSKPDWQHDGSMDQARRRAIAEALTQCNYSVARAARRLRIGRSTLYRLIKEFDVQVVDCTRKVQDEKQPAKEVFPQDSTSKSGAHGRGKLVQVGDQLFIVNR